MLEIDWEMDKGWGKPRISEYKNLSLSPASTGLHYGKSGEGVKWGKGGDFDKLFGLVKMSEHNRENGLSRVRSDGFLLLV